MNDRPSNINGVKWSQCDDMNERLRELWAQGLKAVEIGERLGVSKNSVIGRVHRMGLPPRPSPIGKGRPIGTGRPKQDSKAQWVKPTDRLNNAEIAELRAKQSAAPKVKPPSAPPKPAVELIPEIRCEPEPIPAIVLPRLTACCQFPLWGDRDRPTMQFCDAPVQVGVSWCVKHHAVVFTKSIPWGHSNDQHKRHPASWR